MENSAENSYPLSPMQEGMLFHSLRAPRAGFDIEQVVVSLRELLDASSLRRAWEKVVQRHATLRVCFRWEGLPTPTQTIRPLDRLPFNQLDRRGLSRADQETQLRDFLQEDRRQGFRLDDAPLHRLTLFRFAETDYRLVWTVHHALLDGRSFPLVLKEVFACDEALRRGEDLELPRPRPYRDYVDWLQGLDLAPAEAFWRRLLHGFISSTPLLAKPALDAETGQVGPPIELETRLGSELTEALGTLARATGVTLNTLCWRATTSLWLTTKTACRCWM